MAKLVARKFHLILIAAELREQLRLKREAKTVMLSVLRRGSEISVNIEPRRGPSRGAAHSIPL
ncbi:MAG TPA: hypothetical protein VEL77_02435 [Rugosimonospora sp.]|nr:hypothetical protein [Rugosimonospora sp.]